MNINDKKVNRILLLMTGGIGDILVTTPVIGYLKKLFPHAIISIVLRSEFRELLSAKQGIDEVIPFKKNPSFVLGLLKDKFDLFIDLHTPTYNTVCPNYRVFLRDMVISLFVRARYKIGFAAYGYGLFLTHPVIFNQSEISQMNIVDLTAKLLSPFGIDHLDAQHKSVALNDEARRSLDRKLEAIGYKGGRFVLLHLFSKQSASNWDLKKYEELIGKINHDLNVQTFIIGGLADRSQCDFLNKQTGAIDFAGKLELGETVQLINRSSLVVCVDSGPMHIADALDKKIVALFSDHGGEGIWEPRSRNVIVLRKKVPCGQCFKRDCEDNVCMKLITVDEVFDAVKKLWNEK